MAAIKYAKMSNFRLMYIDDSPEDIRIVTNVVQRVDGEVEVEPYTSGKDALEKLCSSTNLEDLPDVILLDLNMPGMSGHEVLKQIKSRPVISRIPVVIFTSSEQPRDVVQSYEEHASSVIIKPDELTDYITLFSEVISYWKEHAASPLRVVHKTNKKK